MSQRIRDRVVVSIISGAVSAAVVGVVALALSSLSDGRLVKEMGGITQSDLEGYAKASDLPDTSSFLKREELSDSTFLTTSSKLICEPFTRENNQLPRSQCPPNTYKLAQWCSGNCSKNDA